MSDKKLKMDELIENHTQIKADLELLDKLSKHNLTDESKKFIRHVITYQLKELGEDKAFDTLFKFINARTGTEIIKYNQSLETEKNDYFNLLMGLLMMRPSRKIRIKINEFLLTQKP